MNFETEHCQCSVHTLSSRSEQADKADHTVQTMSHSSTCLGHNTILLTDLSLPLSLSRCDSSSAFTKLWCVCSKQSVLVREETTACFTD